MNRAEAIEWLRAAGRNAEARDWAHGKTIAITVGEASTVDGITVYPGIVYLYPMTGAGWGLLDCDVADPAATYDDLEAAVRGAHEYIGQKEAGLNSSFERVYTMTDYYDGPRGGIASFRGRPHVYESMFADARDAYSDVFELRPVDDETFRIALEDWEMWLRWEDAFARGATSIETHPALPADRARHDELAPLLASRLAARSNSPVYARAEFRPLPDQANARRGRWLTARWTTVPPEVALAAARVARRK